MVAAGVEFTKDRVPTHRCPFARFSQAILRGLSRLRIPKGVTPKGCASVPLPGRDRQGALLQSDDRGYL